MSAAKSTFQDPNPCFGVLVGIGMNGEAGVRFFAIHFCFERAVVLAKDEGVMEW